MVGNTKNIVVIGAGIIGVCAALEVLRRGHAVTIVDREGPASACSFGNAGLFAESSYQPIATPDTLKKVPGWLLRNTGPVALQWRYLPGLVPWLTRFLASAFRSDMAERGNALHALTDNSTARYEKLAAEAGVPELAKRVDIMHAFRDPEAWALNQKKCIGQRAKGYSSDVLDTSALLALEPDLDPAHIGGVISRNLGFTPNAGRLTQAIYDLFLREGGMSKTATVASFDITPDGAVAAIKTSDGDDIPCDGVVLAAGAWSARLLDPLGVKIPLETERGYHVLVRNPGVTVTHPVYGGEDSMVATPMEEGLRIAGTVEFASVDAPPNPARVENILKGARGLFPRLNTSDIEPWMGCRPTLPDSLPIIDTCPNHRNLTLTFGHQHLGLTCAPATAPLVADLVDGRTPNVEIASFRATRFR